MIGESVCTLSCNPSPNYVFVKTIHVHRFFYFVLQGFFVVGFFVLFFFMQKDLGESMRMFEVPELEGPEK